MREMHICEERERAGSTEGEHAAQKKEIERGSAHDVVHTKQHSPPR
tara:strand:- start:32 stop:169 length:138 start_codon:yes stop_codon:yes gene_type:complete